MVLGLLESFHYVDISNEDSQSSSNSGKRLKCIFRGFGQCFSFSLRSREGPLDLACASFSFLLLCDVVCLIIFQRMFETFLYLINKEKCIFFEIEIKISVVLIRGSSKLVSLASQLTKPLKVKRLFPSLVCFLNPSPEAPSSIDLKRENMNSILIITNLTCWLLVS